MCLFNVCAKTDPNTVNPYTHKSAQASFNESTNNNVQQTSKIKLWAIRIFSDILSVITQPIVLGVAGFAIQITAMCLAPVGIALTLVTLAMNLMGCATLIFASINRDKLMDVSKFYAAKADLAKAEIDSRNAQANLIKLARLAAVPQQINIQQVV